MSLVREALSPTVRGISRAFACHSATLSGDYPPNSLAAVEECLREGVPRLELDVRFMADDSMAIFHDERLDRATDSAGRLSEMKRQDLAGVRYRGGEHGICFLEDVVARTAGSRSMLQVDLKLMRPITQARVLKLCSALAPLDGNLIVGSQAHWNLRQLEGLPLAFDPTLQWRYPQADFDEPFPKSLGVHGLLDDSPIASDPHVRAGEYIEARIADIAGLLPSAVEWMVDIRTILHFSDLGSRCGERLRQSGTALAAWTLRKETANPADCRAAFGWARQSISTDMPLAAAGNCEC